MLTGCNSGLAPTMSAPRAETQMDLGITCCTTLPTIHHAARVVLLTIHVKHKPAPYLQFLILVIFKFQAIHILPHTGNLSSIESSRFRVASEDMFANREIWQRCIWAGDRDQRLGESPVHLTRGTALIRFGVLNLVPDMCSVNVARIDNFNLVTLTSSCCRLQQWTE